MKSDRRHELQHNDLAEWFLTTYQAMLPYRNLIIFGTLFVVVAVVAVMIWRNHSQSATAAAWNEVEIPQAIIQYPAAQMAPVYQFPGYAEAMDAAGRNYSGTPAGQWARLLTADTLLAIGEAEITTQKENAGQHFNIAMDHYQKTLDDMSNPIARQRAMFAKGRLFESVGKLAEAAAAYQDLNKEYPKGIYTAVAEGRLEQLKNPETAEFYQALAKYTPKKTEKPAAKKGGGNAAAGPRGALENMTLPENPEEPAPSKSSAKPGGTIKPGASGSGSAAATAKTSAAPAVPATSAAPPSAASKTSAAIPRATGAPAASGSGPAKK